MAGTALAAVAVYVLMWIGYGVHWNWLNEVDAAGLAWPYRYGSVHPTWVAVWDVFCAVLGPAAFRLVGLVVVVVALLRRRRRIALFVCLAVVLNGIVIEVAKFIAARPRPDTALVHAASTSFPSGHALGVMASVLALLTVAWPMLSGPVRGWLCAAGALVVVAIGVGRVVLNVHHPSDVLAGWALGYSYFVGCLLLAPPYRKLRAADETPAVPGSER